MNPKYPDLYKKYFVDKNDERCNLFRGIQQEFKIKKGLYPGSFTHITPSFFIPEMVYVDSDKRCKKFYEGTQTKEFVENQKKYNSQSVFRFYQQSFTRDIDEAAESFDLLVSFYAGFISKYCKKYLRKNGVLIANNSHGDAPLAYLDSDFAFIAVVKRNGDRFTLKYESLESYFQMKSGKDISKEEIEKTMRGPAYVTTAYAYVFRKLR